MSEQVIEQPTQPAGAPELTPQDLALHAALAAGRARHADFNLLLPTMDSLALALYPSGQYPPDPKGISAEEFVECLYVIAKHAYFTEDVRKIAFTPTPKGIM